MARKKLILFFIIIGIIIIITGIILLSGYGYDRPPGSSGIGPRGGHWHITSGGNKSYYQPKTSNWGIQILNDVGVIGIVLLVIGFLIIISGAIFYNMYIKKRDCR